jgi:hypothetical protein
MIESQVGLPEGTIIRYTKDGVELFELVAARRQIVFYGWPSETDDYTYLVDWPVATDGTALATEPKSPVYQGLLASVK